MQNRIVVGIAGGSASGKSTLAAAIVAPLGKVPAHRPAILAADRYMHADRSGAPRFFSPTAGTHMFNANHPDAVDWEALLRDLDALLQAADGPDVLLVEGLM